MSQKILTPSNNPEAFKFRSTIERLVEDSIENGYTTTQIASQADSIAPIYEGNYGFLLQGSETNYSTAREVFGLNVGHTNAFRDFLFEQNPEKKEQAQNTIIRINQKIADTIESGMYKSLSIIDFNADGFYLSKADFDNPNSGVNNLGRIARKYNSAFVPTHNFSNSNTYIEAGTLTLNNSRNFGHNIIHIIPDIITLRSYYANQSLRIGSEKDGQFETAYNTVALTAEVLPIINATSYGSFLSSPQERKESNVSKISAFRRILNRQPDSKLTCMQDGNLYGEHVDSTDGLKILSFLGGLSPFVDPNIEGKKLQQMLEGTEFAYLMPNRHTFLGASEFDGVIGKIKRAIFAKLDYKFDAAIVNYPADIRVLRKGYPEFDHRPTVVNPK